MSEDDITLAPRPKRYRIGLFGPTLLCFIAFGAWSGYWFYTKDQITKRVDAQFTALQAAGYTVAHDPYAIRGYPYRMFLELKNVTVIAPSGRGVAAPVFQAEANAYALDKWVMTAPQGLTLYRGHPGGVELGTLAVTGTALKASASGLTHAIYNIALQGTALKLVPSDPTRPFAFTTADDFEAYVRPTKDIADSADMLIRLSGAHGDPHSMVGDLSADKPSSLHVEGVIPQVSAFKGHTFADGLKAWTANGGRVTGFQSQVTAGDLDVRATSDGLGIDDGGHLHGKMKIEMNGAFHPVAVLAALHLISPDNMTLASPLLDMTLSTNGTQKLPLDFHDGGAFIGPLKVSDAPILP